MRIYRRALQFLIITVGFQTFLFAETARDAEMFRIEFQLVVTDQSWMESQAIETSEDGSSVYEVRRITVGNTTLDMNAADLWDGETKPPKESGIRVLATPRVTVSAGDMGVMRSGSAGPTQYLEWDGESCYRVNSLPSEVIPGLHIEVSPRVGRPSDQPDAVFLDLTLKTTILGKREPVPGLGFDVGRPAVQTTELESHHQYLLDRWTVVTSQLSRDATNGRDETLLVFLRVSRL